MHMLSDSTIHAYAGVEPVQQKHACSLTVTCVVGFAVQLEHAWQASPVFPLAVKPGAATERESKQPSVRLVVLEAWKCQLAAYIPL